MPKKARVAKFTQEEVVIAVACAAGCTLSEAAATLGISERWCHELKDRYSDLIDPLAILLKSLIKFSKKEIKQLAKVEMQAELEKKLGAAAIALDNALESNDPKIALDASKEVLNRVLGKSVDNINVKQSGSVRHIHAHVTDPRVLQALDQNVLADFDLHKRARQLQSGSGSGEIIDVESAAGE